MISPLYTGRRHLALLLLKKNKAAEQHSSDSARDSQPRKKGAKSLHWLELSLPLTLATQISCACVKAKKTSKRASFPAKRVCRISSSRRTVDDEMRRRRQRFCSTTAWQQLNKWTEFRIGNRGGRRGKISESSKSSEKDEAEVRLQKEYIFCIDLLLLQNQ